MDFPGGSDGKAFAYNVGDPGLIPGCCMSVPAGAGGAGDEPCPLQVLAYASASDGEPVQLAPAEVELGDLVKVSAPF